MLIIYIRRLIKTCESFIKVHYSVFICILLLCMSMEYMYRQNIGYIDTLHSEHYANVIFDVSFILLICCICTGSNHKYAINLANVIVLATTLVNVVYYRFFNSFCVLSVLTESSNLDGSWWFNYIPIAFKWTDIIVLIVFFLNIIIVNRSAFFSKNLKKIHAIFLYGGGVIFATVLFQYIIPLQRGIRQHTAVEIKTFNDCFGSKFNNLWSSEPDLLTYEYGIVRTHWYFSFLSLFESNESLDNVDLQKISILNNNKKYNSMLVCPQKTNIVFVLVESFLSSSINHLIDGEHVTPCIDSLISQPTTITNLRMKPNITIGESSDGQMIYLTGLLPIKNAISVQKIISDDVKGLPQLFKDKLKFNTAITIPTKFNVWHQGECNKKYGFNFANSTCSKNSSSFGKDEDVFNKAYEFDKSLKQPFFHLMLTVSTHATYTDLPEYITPWKKNHFPKCYSNEYCNYLMECHYMDSELCKYINKLKRLRLWDHTILVIASDHNAHLKFLNMPNDLVRENELPFILVNTGIKKTEFVSSSINQIDVYPTIMNLYGLNSWWHGFGRSIFMPMEYRNMATEENYVLSSKMIKNNYFKGK